MANLDKEKLELDAVIAKTTTLETSIQEFDMKIQYVNDTLNDSINRLSKSFEKKLDDSVTFLRV